MNKVNIHYNCINLMQRKGKSANKLSKFWSLHVEFVFILKLWSFKSFKDLIVFKFSPRIKRFEGKNCNWSWFNKMFGALHQTFEKLFTGVEHKWIELSLWFAPSALLLWNPPLFSLNPALPVSLPSPRTPSFVNVPLLKVGITLKWTWRWQGRYWNKKCPSYF